MTRPGLQNQAQKAPKIEAKSLPGAFKQASKRVPKKASILDPIFKLLFIDFGGPRKLSRALGRNARALAGHFLIQRTRRNFENCSDRHRPFGCRRIAFPFGGTPPPARHLSACPPCILWQGILAGHLWSCRALLTGSWGLLRPSWSLLGCSWRPPGAFGGAQKSTLAGSWVSWLLLGRPGSDC